MASYLFRLWVRLHPPGLCLSQMRPMWYEARRFVREHQLPHSAGQSYLPPPGRFEPAPSGSSSTG